MYLLIILNFICICCLGVFFFIQLKEKEDDIEELYDLYYGHLTAEENKKKNEKVLRYDKRIF